ncbi:hypothetical protein [Nocardia brevicatena]|uniref:hypothetical protein n=1 Tax=Nocardia brevicatena TaxID=37327 RepID=UPI0012FB32EA|nr:hypothetical protein [Nocardia brevicatena]
MTVHYLRGSIEAVDLDPVALPASAASTMNFPSATGSEVKAWRDIWVRPAAEVIDRLVAEHRSARERPAALPWDSRCAEGAPVGQRLWRRCVVASGAGTVFESGVVQLFSRMADIA